MPCHTLPFIVVNHCSKHSNKPLGTPQKLIQILVGDGNCLFRALSYTVTGRQIILYSSEYCLVNGQLARNKVRVKGIEILSAASLLSTDIFVYTQFGDTYKWQI